MPVFLQRRDLVVDRGPAPFLGGQAVLGQLPLHEVDVRFHEVDLVHGDDDGHLRLLGVVDRLDGLGHDAVHRRDDQHDDVGHLGAARAHHGEGLVAGGVQEHDPALDLPFRRWPGGRRSRPRCAG